MLLFKMDKIIMTGPVNFVVDMDISKFFDTVDHKRLMKCLKQRIVDPTLLRLIGRFLMCAINLASSLPTLPGLRRKGMLGDGRQVITASGILD